ncbi:hypothetical protein CBR_g38945 [Chara braunii]|uniref:Coenzyme Q-binding protein COQ10 START domain-containing protein n=1 Tax=Chara braunii TaxID=69332 RepID=A0A388K0Q5_CHABU|nr:hypothetical protein CBR_g38945 [Chara braunii]|eukprot:GBG63634.1 hypothetical protein CBR_g38945 [Chara braunii]
MPSSTTWPVLIQDWQKGMEGTAKRAGAILTGSTWSKERFDADAAAESGEDWSRQLMSLTAALKKGEEALKTAHQQLSQKLQVGRASTGLKNEMPTATPGAASASLTALSSGGMQQTVALTEALIQMKGDVSSEASDWLWQWRPLGWGTNFEWVDEPPVIKVTAPKKALCTLDCKFKVGLPADDVYRILVDPENCRVFKNIKEVKYRRVLKQDQYRQKVETEQAAKWRFLWLSGTFDIALEITEDKRDRQVDFKLARPGFMTRFEGYWNVLPLEDDSAPPSSSSSCCSNASGSSPNGPRASLVTLHQYIMPSVIPPPPLDRYVRGITVKTTHDTITDLQGEAYRIRKGLAMLAEEELKKLKSEILLVGRQKGDGRNPQQGGGGGKGDRGGGGDGEGRRLKKFRARNAVVDAEEPSQQAARHAHSDHATGRGTPNSKAASVSSIRDRARALRKQRGRRKLNSIWHDPTDLEEDILYGR